MKTWIIAECDTSNDGVCISKMIGTENDVKKYMASRMRWYKREFSSWDYGDTSARNIKRDAWGYLNAYGTLSDFHVDISAIEMEEVPDAC